MLTRTPSRRIQGSRYFRCPPTEVNPRAYRRAEGGDADYDGTAELLATFADVGDDAAAWADKVVNNRKPAHTKKNAPLKAEVVRQAAEKLEELGYTRREHLHRASAEDKELQALKNA